MPGTHPKKQPRPYRWRHKDNNFRGIFFLIQKIIIFASELTKKHEKINCVRFVFVVLECGFLLEEGRMYTTDEKRGPGRKDEKDDAGYFFEGFKGRLTDYMEPPSSILTDSKSKADPRSDDPLSCGFHEQSSLITPNHHKVPGVLSFVFPNS